MQKLQESGKRERRQQQSRNAPGAAAGNSRSYICGDQFGHDLDRFDGIDEDTSDEAEEILGTLHGVKERRGLEVSLADMVIPMKQRGWGHNMEVCLTDGETFEMIYVEQHGTMLGRGEDEGDEDDWEVLEDEQAPGAMSYSAVVRGKGG